MSWRVVHIHSPVLSVGVGGGYPPVGWFELRTDTMSLLVPVAWTSHLRPPLLEALGLDASAGVTVYGETPEGDVTNVVEYESRAPPVFDAAIRVYHVSGSSNGDSPSACASGVDGAFLKPHTAQQPAGTDHANSNAAERTGMDFTSQLHGRLFAYLAHGIAPHLSTVPVQHLSRRRRRALRVQVNQWKKNANKRYKISDDGHLVYLAHKRKRANVVRNLRLQIHPNRIIPFDDEIPEVRSCASIRLFFRLSTKIFVCTLDGSCACHSWSRSTTRPRMTASDAPNRLSANAT